MIPGESYTIPDGFLLDGYTERDKALAFYRLCGIVKIMMGDDVLLELPPLGATAETLKKYGLRHAE